MQTVVATDADSGTNGLIAYSIASGNTGSAFSMHTTSGIVSMAL